MNLSGSQATRALVLGGLAFATSGCELVEGVFKAGVWVGVVAVVVVLALIAWAIKAVL